MKGLIMCFSAGASFVGSGILALLGFFAIKRAPRDYRFFALIPVFFAVQQFSEGIIWLILGAFEESSGPFNAPLMIVLAPLGVLAKALHVARYYNTIKTIAAYIFLFFALIVWPFWIPFSCLHFERERLRRLLLQVLLFLGSLLSLFLLGNLLLYGATVSIIEYHLVYVNPIVFPGYSVFGAILYCCITAGSLVISSLPGAPLLGLVMLCSAGISWYLWYTAFVSVWCFFAALLSVVIVFIIPKK